MKSAAYDFLFPTHIHFIDPTSWAPLTVQFGGRPIKIHKPIGDQTGRPVPQSIGNEQLDIYASILRLELSCDAPPDGQLLYPLLVQCLAWVRVLTRQYWVGFAGSGSTLVRASRLVKDLATGVTEATNFGAFGTPVITRPLSEETWAQVGEAVNSALFPRTADLVFCNGMLALRDRNFQESIALLGIACEVELNHCLRFLLSARGDPVTELLYERSGPDFKWKLNRLLPVLCEREFSEDVPHWHADLLRLYDSRGTAVHAAVGIDMILNAPRFVLAADSFLRWTHEIRSTHGESLGPCPLSVEATIGPKG